MNCRHCQTTLDDERDVFLDLGTAPPSNAFLRQEDLNHAERYFPLKALACPECLLVQVDEVERHDALFSDDYVYFSSFSSTWLAHARQYVSQAIDQLQLTTQSLVVEIASNDGYLLQYVRERGVPCVGVEPTAGTALVARSRGIETVEEFFCTSFARQFAAARRTADLIVANNVLAHVPDINDFVGGLRELLAPSGTITIEFPHLMQLVKHAQFDTVYHEHFSYLSLHTVQRILAAQSLAVWRVEELGTHGGSLRVWAQHATNRRPVDASVCTVLRAEAAAGMCQSRYYRTLQPRALDIKNAFLSFLIQSKRQGKTVMGYGAAAKGNTLLNFAGVRADLLTCVADASPHKQGRFLPGSRIPVVAPSVIAEQRPDYIVVFPWNIREEITTQLSDARSWGARFVTAVPSLVIS